MVKFSNVMGIVLAGSIVAGCNVSDGFNGKFGTWGPDPAMPPVAVATVAQNQVLVLNYLSQNVQSFQRGPLSDWKEATLWGFNVGRQDCEIYMDTLFRLNREKGRNDNLIAALSTAAAAVVTSTTTAQKPLSILAAVFGLSIAANDAVYQTYLFTQAPGLVAKKVADLQEAYRKSVIDDTIAASSPATAYSAIQGYYRLCLPHAIEGIMLQTIADAGPVVPPKDGGSGGGGSGGAGADIRGNAGGKGKRSVSVVRSVLTPELHTR